MVQEIKTPTVLQRKVLCSAVGLKFVFPDIKMSLCMKHAVCEHKTHRRVTASRGQVCLDHKNHKWIFGNVKINNLIRNQLRLVFLCMKVATYAYIAYTKFVQEKGFCQNQGKPSFQKVAVILGKLDKRQVNNHFLVDKGVLSMMLGRSGLSKPIKFYICMPIKKMKSMNNSMLSGTICTQNVFILSCRHKH